MAVHQCSTNIESDVGKEGLYAVVAIDFINNNSSLVLASIKTEIIQDSIPC